MKRRTAARRSEGGVVAVAVVVVFTSLAFAALPDAVALGFVRSGRLTGYGVIRPSTDGRKIGPLFADDPATADTLLRCLLASAPGQTVALTSSTPGSTLRYSLSGDDPGAADTVVASGGTVVLGNFTLKAKAWKLGSLPSVAASANYTLSGPFTTGDVNNGSFHTLAVTPDGTVWAWGSESDALGYEGTGAVPRRAGGSPRWAQSAWRDRCR